MRYDRLILGVLSLCAGCDVAKTPVGGDQEDTGCTAPDWYADADGDGYGAGEAIACQGSAGLAYNALDCDDDDDDAHPGAAEVCDGVDNDCNGEIDEDDARGSTWYADADGDGYGDGERALVACDAPEGYVGDASDCDDTTLDAYPDADEICDGIDNDCDGEIDTDAKDAPSWYIDIDDDGHGSPRYTERSCEQPDGYVEEDDDCDDLDGDVHPGADERCDGVDDDCNGERDDAYAIDAPTWYLDADEDGFGATDLTTQACDVPDGYAELGDDCDDGDADISPDAEEVGGDGIDNDCDGVLAVGVTDVFFTESNTDTIWRLERSGDVSEVYVTSGSVADLTLDDETDTLYYTTWNSPHVRSVGTDGSDPTSLYTSFATGGQGIAIDPASGSLFWGEYYGGLYVGSMDGSDTAETLVTADELRTAGKSTIDGVGYLVADPEMETIYFETRDNYTAPASAGRYVWSIGYDGDDLTIVKQLDWTACIAIDTVNRDLYFTDYDDDSKIASLYRLALDGAGTVEALFEMESETNCTSLAIDPYDEAVYYGDATILYRTRLDGSDTEELVTGVEAPFGLALRFGE